MSQDNKNKNTPPSIEELISNDLSASDTTIDLDEFSLDNLNLDNLDSLLEKAPDTPPAKSALKPNLQKATNVDLDFDARKATPKKADGSDILDELEALSQAQTEQPKTGDEKIKKDVQSALLSGDDFTEPKLPSMSGDAGEPTKISKNDDGATADNKKDESPTPVATPVPKPAKKSLFGGKKEKTAKPAKTSKEKPTAKAKRAERPKKTKTNQNGDSKRLIMIILGALIALLVLIGLWFFMNGNAQEEMPPATETTSVPATPDTPQLPAEPTAETAPETLPSEPMAGAEMGVPAEAVGADAVPSADTAPTGLPDTSAIDAAAAGAMANTAPTAMPAPAPAPVQATAPTPAVPTPTNAEMIDVKSITNADIPEDPALIKEEIDRLNDKDGQFSEQAKLIDEQLTLMKDLTKQKEEQIALLEAQIAQLEKQKQGK